MPAPSTLRQRAASAAGAGAGIARLAERVNLTSTGVIAIVMMILGWWAARVIGSRTMYLIVYAALLTMTLAWVVTRRRLAMTVVRSELPRRMRVGQLVPVELTISTSRKLTTLMLEEHIPPRLGISVRIPIGSLGRGEELRHAYTLSPALRGVYTVGPATASWSDPFGFTIHKQVLPEPTEIVVHPPIEVVHDRVLTRMWEDPPIRPPVSRPWPVGFEFYGMRDYVPGDDLRRVVWPVLAKTGKIMVRESEQGITDRVVIVLDTDREWHSPGEISETFETAVKTVSSLGARHLHDGFSVNIITNESRAAATFRGTRSELPFLDALARLELGDRPLAATSSVILEELRAHPHVLFVTPHLGLADAQQIRLITARGLSVVVVHVVWEESDLQSAVRAAAVGARVVQIEPGASLEAVFQHHTGSKARR